MAWLKTWIRALACTFASISMLVSPLAQGAKAADDRETRIREFIKYNELATNHPITIGEFHYRYNAWYPEKLRSQLGLWAAVHKNEPMPKMEVEKIKDASGADQFRLVATIDGKTVTFTTGEDFLKINNVKMTVADYYDTDGFIKRLTTEDKTMAKELAASNTKPLKLPTLEAPTRDEFSRMTPEMRAKYLVTLRLAFEDSEKILAAARHQEPKKGARLVRPVDFVISNWLMGREAFADLIPKAGDQCIIAGYLGTYGTGKSCGGAAGGDAALQSTIDQQFKSQFATGAPTGCASTSVPCNPLIYGFDENNSAHCVSRQPQVIVNATRLCNEASPLEDPPGSGHKSPEKIKQIVASLVRAQTGKDPKLSLNKDGKLPQDQFNAIKPILDALNHQVKAGDDFCQSEAGQKLRLKRPDQEAACNAIHERYADLLGFADGPSVIITDCNNDPRARIDRDLCPPMHTVKPLGEITETTLPDARPAPDKKEDKGCGIICPLLIAGAVGLGIWGILSLFKSKPVATPVYSSPCYYNGTMVTCTSTPTTLPPPLIPVSPVCPTGLVSNGVGCVVPASEGGTITPGTLPPASGVR